MKQQNDLMVSAIPKMVEVFTEVNASITREINPLVILEGSETPDQYEWRFKVSSHFSKIFKVLRSEAGEGDEWKSARNWANIYLSLYVLIHQGFLYTRRELSAKLSDQSVLTPARMTAEIVWGHYLFWLSRASEGYWTFPVKAIRDGLRKSKKLETTDRLDLLAYHDLYKQVSAHAESRIGDSIEFFAPEIVCLKILRDTAKKDKHLKIWLNTYDQMMDQAVRDALNELRQGTAKGFGFSKGFF